MSPLSIAIRTSGFSRRYPASSNCSRGMMRLVSDSAWCAESLDWAGGSENILAGGSSPKESRDHSSPAVRMAASWPFMGASAAPGSCDSDCSSSTSTTRVSSSTKRVSSRGSALRDLPFFDRAGRVPGFEPCACFMFRDMKCHPDQVADECTAAVGDSAKLPGKSGS